MNILKIYQKYKIPPNLVRHQLEVTVVGRFVADHWSGPPVDKDLITKTLLLHDMGNIIKFKRPFFGKLENNAPYWEKIQQEFITKYGNDVHKATLAIAEEIGETQVLTFFLEQMKAVWLSSKGKIPWEARICEYADCCVTPEGIVSFSERIEDLKNRYHKTEKSSAVIYMRDNARKVESKMTVKPGTITETNFSKEIDFLLKNEI